MSTLRGKMRRNASNIAIIIVMLAAGTILYVQALATSQLQRQVAQQQQIIQQVKDLSIQLNNRADERTKQIDTVNRHLDCIVQFFAQSDRSQKAIADIDTCTLTDTNTGFTTKLSPSSSTTPSSSSSQSTPQKTVSPQQQTSNNKPSLVQRDIEQPIKDILNLIF